MKRPTDKQIGEALAVLASAYCYVLIDTGPTWSLAIHESATGGLGLHVLGMAPSYGPRAARELPGARKRLRESSREQKPRRGNVSAERTARMRRT